MSGRSAIAEGLRRMLRAPGLVGLVWLLNVAIALPAAVLVGDSIQRSVGRSHVHGKLLAGLDTGWLTEYAESGTGLPGTMSVSALTRGAWLDTLDRWWDGTLLTLGPAVLAVGALFAVAWLLVLGGVLEALREGSPKPRLGTVLADGLTYFPRLARLTLATAVLYYGLFRLAHWLFPQLGGRLIDVTSERTVLAVNLAAALGIVGLLVAIRMASDLAKAALVLDRRRSALAGLVRGFALLVRHPLRLAAVAAGYGLLGAGLMALHWFVTPGVGQARPGAILVALAVAQLLLAGKFALRVAFLASEVTLYERLG